MGAGTYLLVKFNDRDKLIPAIESLTGNQQLDNWDAVDGHYNLVLKSKSDISDQIQSLEGFASLDRCDLLSDSRKVETDDEFTYSYIFIETAKDCQAEIKQQIEELEAVVFVDATSGSFDLVGLLKGKSFGDIDNIIASKIKILDGVLRLKQDHVIYLDRM